MTTTHTPATRGTCGIVGCTQPADIETQTRIGPSTWAVRLDCLGHAPATTLDEMAAR